MVENGFLPTRNLAFFAGLRVIVVDDDPTCLKILETLLKRCSYEVTTCMSAVHALSLLRARKDGYDIILSDVHMPDMDGFELLELIKLEMDIPVVLISADGGASQVMKGILLGACDYLLKPVSIEGLMNIWQHSVRKKMQNDIEVLEGTRSIGITREESNQYDNGDLICVVDTTSFKKGSDVKNKNYTSSKQARAAWSYHQKFDSLPSSSRNFIIGIPTWSSGNTEQKDAANGTQHSSPSVGNHSWFKTQHKYTSNGSYGVSVKHRGHESDEEETVSMPRKRTLAVVSDSSNSKSSKYECCTPDSSTSSGSSETKFAAFDSTFLFQLPRDDEEKHNSRN